MLLIPDTNIAFVHIPKTAGQAVRKAFGIRKDSRSSHTVDTPEDRALMRDDIIRFCVVRDPLARFVSAYRYNANMAAGGDVKGFPALLTELNAMDDINRLVDYLKDVPDRSVLPLHLRPQGWFIAATRPQIILRQERLTRDIQIIAQLAPHAWRGLKRVNDASKRFGADVPPALSDENREFVVSLYAEDYALLGYRR